MNHGVGIEIIHGSYDAILEFLLGCDADVAQDRASKFGEEAFDEVELGAVGRSEGEFEAVRGLIGKPGLRFLGDVRGMIVEDQLDGGVGRIGGIDELEEFNELAAAVATEDNNVYALDATTGHLIGAAWSLARANRVPDCNSYGAVACYISVW
jgi:hypothetical protein